MSKLKSMTVLFSAFLFVTEASSRDLFVREIAPTDAGGYIHASYTAIAIDSEGFIHLCFRDPNHDIRYATSRTENGTWKRELIFSGRRSAARENAIVVDQRGRPHVSFSYSDGSAEDLMYAERTNSGKWRVETVDTTESSGMENDIAIDQNGFIHISHWNWNGSELRYSTNKSGKWKTVTLDEGLYWDRTAIGVDNDNRVHIVYRSDQGLMHYSNGTYEIVDASVRGSSDPDLAIDHRGRIHVVYSDESGFKYARKNTADEWLIEYIRQRVSPGRYRALTVGSNGRPHVVYRDADAEALIYGTRISRKWEHLVADGYGETGYSNSIAVSKKGAIRVSYRYNNLPSTSIRDIWGYSDSFVIAVGDNGRIVRFDGKTWNIENSGIERNLYSVWGFSPSDVYAVGGGRTVLHYDGSVWSVIYSEPHEASLLSIWGSSPDELFAGDTSGNVHYYNGDFWKVTQIGSRGEVYALWGTSSSNLYAAVSRSFTGYIFHYDGSTWTHVADGDSALYSIWGNSKSDIFAAGYSSEILHFDGRDWSIMHTDASTIFRSIWSSSPSNVYAVGDYGVVAHYDGKRWVVSEPFGGYGTPGFSAIWGVSDHDIFASGKRFMARHDGSFWEAMNPSSVRIISNRGLIGAK